MTKDLHMTNNRMLKELKNKLRIALHDSIISIRLFGSRARGDYDSESDIDVAFIVKDHNREIRNKILAIVTELESKYYIPLSITIFSNQDFKRLKKKERRI